MPLYKGISKRASIGVFGAVAVGLTFGAAQLASGRDLSAPQDRLQQSMDDLATNGLATNGLAANETAINRAAKTDRAAGVAGSPAQTKTISLRLEGVSDTSVLIRIPVAQARNGSSAVRPGDLKMKVACEPVVSVLTEVAKLLQPGRCLT